MAFNQETKLQSEASYGGTSSPKIGILKYPIHMVPQEVNERMLVLNNLRGVFEDKKLYGITPLEKHELRAYLNCWPIE